MRLLATVGLSFGAVACAPGTGSDDVYTLSLASPLPETATFSQPFKDFAERLETESGGRIDVEIYWSGSLIPYAAALDGTGSGIADIGYLPPSYFPQELELSNWAAPTVNFADSPFPWNGAVAGSVATFKMLQDPVFESEFDNSNVVLLSSFASPPYVLQCTEPIISLADANSRKARSPGASHAAELDSMGMQPMTMDSVEVFQALQRGILDCSTVAMSGAANTSVLEIAKDIAPVLMSPTINYLVVNKDTLESLPEDLQSVLRDAGVEFIRDSVLNLLETEADVFRPGGAGERTRTQDAPELSALLAEHQRSVLDGLVDDAPGAISAEDAARIVAEYKDEVRRLTEVLESLGWDTSELEGDFASRVLADGDNIDVLRQYFAGVQSELIG